LNKEKNILVSIMKYIFNQSENAAILRTCGTLFMWGCCFLPISNPLLVRGSDLVPFILTG